MYADIPLIPSLVRPTICLRQIGCSSEAEEICEHISSASFLAPVVQWIKQLRPKEKLCVRITAGAPSNMTKRLQNISGWYGILAILVAYGLLSFKVINADNLVYQLLNLKGAAGIIIETAAKKDMQPVVLNIVWAAVALMAIIRIVIS